MNTVDKTIIEWFSTDFGTNFSNGLVGSVALIFLSFILTLIFSGLLGFEREYHGHSAGLRTHVMIALGACTIMVLSLYGFGYWDSIYLPQGISRDPARLAAQVVSGIGFLGAGTIIQTGMNIKGLTTATTLWVAMAIGLACGSGCFIVAGCVTAFSFFVLIGLSRLEILAAKRNPAIILIVPTDHPILGTFLSLAKDHGIQVEETFSELITYQGKAALRLVARIGRSRPGTISAFVDMLRSEVRPLSMQVNASLTE